MTSKELLDVVIFTGLYEPKNSWRNGYLDDQCYNYCVPFRYKENKIVMVDTYHIKHYGNYDNFIREREEEKEKTRDYIPYVSDYYYKHYRIIDTIEELEKCFNLVCDLKEYHPVDDREYAKYKDEDRFENISLWYECKYFQNGYKLVKNDASIFYGRDISVQLNELKYNTSYSFPHISEYKLNELKEKTKSADSKGVWYDKDFYEKILKWNDFLNFQKQLFEKTYKEIFNIRSYACESQEELEELIERRLDNDK